MLIEADFREREPAITWRSGYSNFKSLKGDLAIKPFHTPVKVRSAVSLSN
jgi:hypothetical protein